MEPFNNDVQKMFEAKNGAEDEDQDKVDDISYVKLYEHIVNIHPRNKMNEETREFEKWSFKEPLGHYYVPFIQNKK